MNTLFGLDLCVGTVCNCIDLLSPVLEPAAEEASESLAEPPNLDINESGWKCKGERRYLWVFVSHLVVHFTIANSRGSKALKSVTGRYLQGGNHFR